MDITKPLRIQIERFQDKGVKEQLDAWIFRRLNLSNLIDTIPNGGPNSLFSLKKSKTKK